MHKKIYMFGNIALQLNMLYSIINRIKIISMIHFLKQSNQKLIEL